MNTVLDKEVLSENKDGLQVGEEENDRKFMAHEVDRELNLKGKVCPYTFVESMLALEEMETGEVLRVIVDYPPAVCDVPKSLKNEGYEILDVSPMNETDWAILVKNTEFK
jgi:tRNA 2-thiouridine synthesizing protein A